MSTKILSCRFAVLALVGALLAGGFVSGCQTKVATTAAPTPTPDPGTIHHPPGGAPARVDGKDGPARHRRTKSSARITHPGG